MAGYDNYIDVIKDKDNNFYAIHAFTDSITSSQLKTSAVTTSKIASEAVTSAKLATGAVTVAKLASDVQELMSTKGVMTLNGISGAVSVLPGATNGTVQIKNATNQTSTVSITGLGTAAYQPSSAFAPAYNYVKTINGQTASSNGNISVATGDIYTIKYSSTFNMSSVVERLQTSQAIRLATRYTATGDNSDEKNYAELVRYTLVDEYEEGASEPTSTHVGEMLFQRNGLILFSSVSGEQVILQDDRGQLQTFRWSYDSGWSNYHYAVPATSSPEFTGTPIAPTASVATSNTQIATTAFVKNAISTITADQVGFGSPAIPNATNVNTALVSLASKVTNLTANQIGCQTVAGDRDVGEALDTLYSNFDNIYATNVHFSGSTFPSAITTVDSALEYLKDTSAGSATEPIVVTYGDDITYAQFQQIHNNNRIALLIDPNGLLPSGQYGTAWGYVAETYHHTSLDYWFVRFQLNDFSDGGALLSAVYTYSSSQGSWSVERIGFVSQTQFGQLSSTVSNLAQDVDGLTTDDIKYATDTTKTATSVLSSLQSTKANISSPTFTGTPQAPTASSATSTTQIATTAFVKSITVPLQSKVSNLTTDDIKDSTDPQQQHTATDWLEYLQSLAVSLSSNKANINSPTFTGTPQAPTASAGTNNTQIATTSFAYNAAKCVKVEYGSTVQQSDIQRAYFSDSKYILCYKDEAPDYEIYQLTHIDDEQGQGDAYDFCQIRNGVVKELHYDAGADSWLSSHYSIVTSSQLSTKANLSSPTFTGVPKAPTASAGTSTTQLATTAFVQQELSNVSVEKNICQAFTASTQYVDAGDSRMSFSLPPSVMARDWDTFVIGSDLSLYSGGIKILQNGRYKLTGVAHIEPAQSYPTGFGIYQLVSGSSSFTNLTSTYGMHEYGTDLYVTATRQLFSGTVVGLYGLADPSIQTDVEYNNISLLVEQIDKNDPIEPIDPLNPSDGEITIPSDGGETG